MVMFRLEGSGGDSGRAPWRNDQREDDGGGAQWVEVANVGSPCALLRRWNVRRALAGLW